MLDIRLLPLLTDNYGYLLHDPASGEAAIVDPSEPEPVLAALAETGWTLKHILNTHHHGDHIGGNAALKAATGARIAGPAADRHRIPDLDIGLADGDTYRVGTRTLRTIEVPGHTSGHIALMFDEDRALFCGDTLFALGCGRMFEGTPQQMWRSLSTLRALPEETRVYCGHEYTQSNCRFAVTIEPGNQALAERAEEIARLRAEGRPTIPSTIGLERRTNPFLRADVPEVQAAIGMEGADPVAVFAELRRRKDSF
ncbi:MAG TPA: hydroxyacylglutathione hydrolase [Aliidongia sp.]|nr:hydroxyacylglutathione hydrolase [Aliidongia sp.]